MAESNITKQALSKALKELMEEKSFEKISVSDICDKCHMNRKSFYYHFRDKYDLANWIFDTEFIELTRKYAMDSLLYLRCSFDERWECIEALCRYFYDNKTFYSKLLQVEGQNSFSDHFRDFLYPLLRTQTEALLEMDDIPQMLYDFVVDGVECAIERWLTSKNGITVEEFIRNLKALVKVVILGIDKRIAVDPKWKEEIQDL